jgi:DNA-binding response OmpR family regulator
MLESGVSEYVMKPFTPEILFEKIESVLGVKVVEDGSL